MPRDLHQEITNKIIEQMEQGQIPWRQPWNGGVPLTMPINGVTGKAYRGINVPLCWSDMQEKGFQSNEFASFKQWHEKKEFVRKGEKATTIVYYDTIEREKDDVITKIPFLKMSFVFNRCQLQSYDPDKLVKPDQTDFVTRIQRADEFINNTGAIIKHRGNRAFYNFAQDYIQLPPTYAFTGTETQNPTEAYYSTKLHELAHWTGHETRCNVQFGKKFTDELYSREELRAELASAFLCAELEITDGPQPDHAGYLGCFITVLKKEPRFLLSVTSMASKATDYLKSLQPTSRDLCPSPV
jgi:antirestriction protein ArdC